MRMLRHVVQRFHAERLPFGCLAGILSLQADIQAGELTVRTKSQSCTKFKLCCALLDGHAP